LGQQWATGPVNNQFPANINQPAIGHPGWTGCFTGATRQAPVEMCDGSTIDGIFFQQILDQVYSSPGTIEFITQQLVGWANCSTETTMHTASKNSVGFLYYSKGCQFWMDTGLH
jgi:hypothetical protein